MNYFVQWWQCDTETWSRDFSSDITTKRVMIQNIVYETKLDALEARDKHKAAMANDGVPRDCRVVSEEGEVIDYA